MSKTIAQLARILGASNEQLFDRYISFRLMRNPPDESNTVNTATVQKSLSENLASIAKKGISKAFSSQIVDTGKDDDFVLVCPASGLKPAITLTADLNVQNTANLITLTVVNMNANIDTMAYNYAEIEAGYLNSGGHTRFAGQIINCYMAKPNPNGELVLSISSANVSSIYSRGTFSVTFEKDVVTTSELIMTCVETMATYYPDFSYGVDELYLSRNLVGDWITQKFTVNKATYSFRSPLECITWLNSLFASGTHGTGFTRGAGRIIDTTFDASIDKMDLPPIKLGFDITGTLKLTSTFSGASPGTVKALTAIGSAFMTGTAAATVTAPFNPNLSPGEVVFIDPKYFKTRVTVTEDIREKYRNRGNLWYIIKMSFTFSTLYTNTMTLMLNNIDNDVSVGEG